MMRSLYSGVSGLKTHQTKMDVIGNNISNVNTVAFKSSNVTFSTIMYQTLSSASGANAATGAGGINAKQIGLGVTTGSTSMTITNPGASETTGMPFDLKITDKSTSSFFVAYNGTENVFTKAGSFYVDGAGNLCMKSTGYTIMGWQVDEATQTIRKDTVSALKIMSPENQTSEPEATTKARCTGVVDNNNTQVTSDRGYGMNLLVYDNLGYAYTAKFAIQAQDTMNGKYAVNLTDIIDASGNSILTEDVTLTDLFGPGSTGDSQGSNINITDNYTFATGKSKTDISMAIQKDAAKNSPATYTYYINAQDVNDCLKLTGDNALPAGYRVRFTSEYPTYAEAKESLLGGGGTITAATGIEIVDANDRVIATNDSSSPTEDAAGITWKFNDANDPTKESQYKLIGETKLSDLTSSAKTVVSDGGVTGYLFTMNAALRKELGLDESDPKFKDGEEYYYWPTLENVSTGEIQMTQADGSVRKFPASSQPVYYVDPAVTPTQNAAGKNEYSYTGQDMMSRKYGIEEALQDYSYTSITGENLAKQTAASPIFTEKLPGDAEIRYNLFGGNFSIVTPSKDGYTLQFDTVQGTLTNIGGGANLSQTLNLSKLSAAGYDGFQDVTIDFSALLNYNNNGSNTSAMSGGDADVVGKGKKLGTMTGLTVDNTGKIYGSYSNGNTVLLGQIAVAQFANAAGLEAVGENCYRTTLNSGEFDGIGVEIDADGSSINTGELEMSNVDLAGEFTSMITTQRGFQANSRIITTSDSMLEELLSLKR